MYMYCPYIRAYILVYVHKELYTFAYVVPETVVFYTTQVPPLYDVILGGRHTHESSLYIVTFLLAGTPPYMT